MYFSSCDGRTLWVVSKPGMLYDMEHHVRNGFDTNIGLTVFSSNFLEQLLRYPEVVACLANPDNVRFEDFPGSFQTSLTAIRAGVIETVETGASRHLRESVEISGVLSLYQPIWPSALKTLSFYLIQHVGHR